VDTKLSGSQQYALVAKKVDSLLGCIRQHLASTMGEVILPLHSVLERHFWSAVSSAGLPSTREIRTYWTELSRGQGI